MSHHDLAIPCDTLDIENLSENSFAMVLPSPQTGTTKHDLWRWLFRIFIFMSGSSQEDKIILDLSTIGI